MSQLEAPQAYNIDLEEVVNIAVSFNGKLEANETLTGSPTATVVPSTGITVDQVAITAASKDINGISVAAGRAVTARVTPTAAGSYVIHVKCGTTAIPAQTRKGKCRLEVTE